MEPVPFYEDALATLYRGDTLDILRQLPDEHVAAVITDPPYSSGGLYRADRMASTGTKYRSTGAARRNADFPGDNRDQRAYGYWSALWLAECWRITEPGGSCLVFTDWRQLPTTSDAIQAGGWVWQGLIVWHKRTARPRRGGFRSECEYLVWGSKGPLRADHEVYLPGVVTTGIARGADRLHLAAKPLELLSGLVEVAPPGSVVLDPFAGSGTTLVAAKQLGRRVVGIELDARSCTIAAVRLAQASLFEVAGSADSAPLFQPP